MILRLRQRMAKEESGFTLVELLVVMLILGLLAAIAIPAFFNQRDKARDAQAKTYARTAETSMETFATDNNGSYSGANAASLVNIESTLTGATLAAAEPATVAPLAGDNANNSYTVTVTSATGNHFRITRHSDGTTALSCDAGGNAGCPTGGNWG
jgi:type IV pilus assembly protein PilA